MPKNSNLISKYKILDGVSSREIEGEVLLMNPSSVELFMLNALGLLIWRQIENNYSLGEIIDLVNKEYNISSEQALSDVVHFLNDLEENGFLVKVDG